MPYPAEYYKVHQWAAEDVLVNDLNRRMLNQLKHYLGQADAPELSTIQNSYRHAMYGDGHYYDRHGRKMAYWEGQSYAENKADKFVRDQILEARKQQQLAYKYKSIRRSKHFYEKRAMKHLGYAMHCMQDATSPAHNDKDGRFRRYHGGSKASSEMAKHGLEEFFYPRYHWTRKKRFSDPSWLAVATLRAWKYWNWGRDRYIPSNPVTGLGHDTFKAGRDWRAKDSKILKAIAGPLIKFF